MRIPGLVDVDTTLRMNKPELQVAIDRDRAADLGVDASDIADSLRLMVGGDDEVSRFRDEKLADDYDVEVRLTGVDRRNADTIGKLFVPSRSGLVRLDNVVKLHEGMTAYRIEGLDRQRQVGIRANIAPGYALADRLIEMFSAAEKLNMPAAYTTTVIGRGREDQCVCAEHSLPVPSCRLRLTVLLTSALCIVRRRTITELLSAIG